MFSLYVVTLKVVSYLATDESTIIVKESMHELLFNIIVQNRELT
jgi:hypothetical protein